MSKRIYNGYVRRYEKWCQAYKFKPDSETILKRYETTLKYDRMLEPNYVKRIVEFLRKRYISNTEKNIKLEEEAKLAISRSKRCQPGPQQLKCLKKIWGDIVNQRKLALPRPPRRYKQIFTREEFDKLVDYAETNYRKSKLALMLWLNVLRKDLDIKDIYKQMNSDKRIQNVIEPLMLDSNFQDLVHFITKEIDTHKHRMFPLSYQSYLKEFKLKCRTLLGKQDANFEMFRRTLSTMSYNVGGK